MNIPPVSIATAKAALIEQYADPVLRRRASMLWGTRGVGKSSIVRQVAEHYGVPLVDLRLTTIEPVDIRGAIYADDALGKTVWFPPEFLPSPDMPAGILFLDELTAADQRLQISAYSLILDRRVGNYRLPDGWQVIAAGNASFHDAVSHDMGTALADRMFHFNVQTVIEAFPRARHRDGLRARGDGLPEGAPRPARRHADATRERPPDRREPAWLGGHLERAALRTLRVREARVRCRGVSALPTRPSSSGCCGRSRPPWTWCACSPRSAATRPSHLLPRTLDALYGMLYGLLAASRDEGSARPCARDRRTTFPEVRGATGLPVREAQTLAMELLMQKALEHGFETTILDSPAYQRYSEQRRAAERGA